MLMCAVKSVELNCWARWKKTQVLQGKGYIWRSLISGLGFKGLQRENERVGEWPVGYQQMGGQWHRAHHKDHFEGAHKTKLLVWINSSCGQQPGPLFKLKYLKTKWWNLTCLIYGKTSEKLKDVTCLGLVLIILFDKDKTLLASGVHLVYFNIITVGTLNQLKINPFWCLCDRNIWFSIRYLASPATGGYLNVAAMSLGLQ